MKAKFTGSQKEFDENDIFHPNNRDWLVGKLDKADEEISANRIIPSSKALFDDVIARGKARLSEPSRIL